MKHQMFLQGLHNIVLKLQSRSKQKHFSAISVSTNGFTIRTVSSWPSPSSGTECLADQFLVASPGLQVTVCNYTRVAAEDLV